MVDVGFKLKCCLMLGVFNNDFLKVVGVVVEGVFLEDIYVFLIDIDLNWWFVISYEVKYKSMLGKIELFGFESVWIVGLVMRKVGMEIDIKRIVEVF